MGIIYAFGEITTTENVRNALGVTDNEVPDSMITGQNLEIELQTDLLSWYPDYLTAWDIFHEDDGSITAEQKILGGLIQLYCQWFCVVRLAETWLAMPAQIGDGKATMRRFAGLDLAAILANARKKMGSFKSQLKDVLDPTRTKGFAVAGTARPTLDPVEGPYPNAQYAGIKL